MGFSFKSIYGSRSSDIPPDDSVPNPLPSCPGSSNCIRTTKIITGKIDTVFRASLASLEYMKPEQILKTAENHRIEAIFRILVFRDDLILSIAKKDPDSSYLHIRSASRMGSTDLGVNRRRVRTFLRLVNSQL